MMGYMKLEAVITENLVGAKVTRVETREESILRIYYKKGWFGREKWMEFATQDTKGTVYGLNIIWGS